MKRKLISKGTIVGLSLLIVTSLFGCGSNAEKKGGVEKNTSEQQTEAESENVTEPTTEPVTEPVTEPTTEPTTEPESETESEEETEDWFWGRIEIAKPEGFYSTKDLILCEINQTIFDGYDKDGYIMPGEYELCDMYEGKYSLTEGSEDKIVFCEYYYKSGFDVKRPYIEVNGVRKEIRNDDVVKVAIVDMDTTDKYKEIALYDQGPSADPNIKLYRYVDGEIYEIGHYSGSVYGEILMDSKGKVVDDWGYISFIENTFVYKYHTVVDNEETEVDVDCEKYLNQTYTLARDIGVSFVKSNNSNLAHIDLDFNLDDLTHLNAGETIKIIKIIDSILFYVQLPDGRIGYILTQTAG